MAFWSSEEKHVPRLSLFVEARVAVLEAQPPPFAPGIVLSVGQFVFPNSSPQLLAAHSDVWLMPPPGFGNPRKIEANPARVALFDAPSSADLAAFINNVPTTPPELRANFLNNNRLTIDAVGLAPGARLLALRRGDTSISIQIDQPEDEKPQVNKNWELEAAEDSVTLRVFQQVFDSISNTTVSILPGSYAARVTVMDPRSGDRPRPRSSNELPFTIAPQIVDVLPAASPPEPATYVLRVVGAYLDSGLDVFFAVGGVALTKVNNRAPIAGEFFLPPPASAPPSPRFRHRSTRSSSCCARPDPDTGSPIPPPAGNNPVPVQLVVNGATATPASITQEAT